MLGCGDCTMCCKLVGVQELDKPRDTWCEHCEIGKGCSIYEDRPQSCDDFECLWLQSQSKSDPMGEHLRPDRCKVVLGATTKGNVQAFVDPGRADAYKTGAMGRLLGAMAAVAPVFVTIGDQRRYLTGGLPPQP